jgi:hypothetical protein
MLGDFKLVLPKGGQIMTHTTGWIDYNALGAVLIMDRWQSTYGYSVNDGSCMSEVSSPESSMTASSSATFLSAEFAYNSPAYLSTSGYSRAVRIDTIREDEPPAAGLPAPMQQLHSDYYVILREQKLIQPFDNELDRSGKRQHVTFMPKEQVPLAVILHFGSSNTATVDKVLCRKIALARKMMRCNRIWTVADALCEVYHLQNLRHFHIVQLVGTYAQGRNLACESVALSRFDTEMPYISCGSHT